MPLIKPPNPDDLVIVARFGSGKYKFQTYVISVFGYNTEKGTWSVLVPMGFESETNRLQARLIDYPLNAQVDIKWDRGTWLIAEEPQAL